MGRAEQAYLLYLRDPGHFASLYLDPQAWANDESVQLLDIYFQYSMLHTNVNKQIPLLFSVPSEAEQARQAYGMGDTSAGDAHLDLAVGGGMSLGGFIFVAGANGVLVPIPEGWTAQVARNGRGMLYQAPGATGDASTIRVMDPVTSGPYQYPNGYVRWTNANEQYLDVNGVWGPDRSARTHIPLDYQGPIRNWPTK